MGIQEELSRLIAALYDEASGCSKPNDNIIIECLDIWDLMFEKQFGSTQSLNKDITDC